MIFCKATDENDNTAATHSGAAESVASVEDMKGKGLASKSTLNSRAKFYSWQFGTNDTEDKGDRHPRDGIN